MSVPAALHRTGPPGDDRAGDPRAPGHLSPPGDGAVPSVATVLGDAREVVSRPARLATSAPGRLVLAALAGVVLTRAFPGYDHWALAAPATGLLALALRGRGARAGALTGLLFGLTAFVPLLSWSGVYVGQGPWLLLAASQAAFMVVFGALAAPALRLPAWPLWYAGLWVAVEAARDRVPFGGFPWARLAFSQAEAPTLGLASLGGAPLVTFAVALAGGLLAAAVTALAGPAVNAVRRRFRPVRRATAAAVCVGLAAAVTAGPLLVPRPTAGQSRDGGPTTVRVALVQGDVKRGLTRDSPEQVLRNHVAATDQLAADIDAGRQPRPDVVLWPEDSSDLDPLVQPLARALVSGAVQRVGAPVVVGAILDGSGDADVVDPGRPVRRNAMVVWTAAGPLAGPDGIYVKRLIVPFGEYIPVRSLARRVSSAVDLVNVDMTPGTRVGALRVGPAVVGPAICFEVAFDGVLRDGVRAGADVLAVPTNNSTFGFTDESVQQLAMSQVRAVEHGRAVLHASTVGVSAIVTPDGVAHGRTQLFTRAVVTGEVPLRTSITVSDRVGAWPEGALSTVGILAAALGGILGSRRRRRPVGTSRPAGAAGSANTDQPGAA